jgi:carbon-monoxide dehydrogenase medium subunit
MHASVILWSPEGERSVQLELLFVGPRQTTLREGEVLLAVLVPSVRPRFGAAYERFGLRDGNAIAVASVAASLELEGDDTVRECRIVLGAVAPIPKLVESAGAAMVRKKPEADAFREAAAAAMSAAEPIRDVRGSAEFRRELVGVLTQRALKTALRRAREAKA